MSRRELMDPAIDWQRLALNIRQSGLPLRQAALEIGLQQRSIDRLARGEIHEPRFTVGLLLLGCHMRHCPDKHDALLRQNVQIKN